MKASSRVQLNGNGFVPAIPASELRVGMIRLYPTSTAPITAVERKRGVVVVTVQHETRLPRTSSMIAESLTAVAVEADGAVKILVS